MKILVLCSPRFDSETPDEKYWPVDKHIISEIKKTGHETTPMLFDKSKKMELDNFDLVFNMCDGFEDVHDESLVPELLAKAGIPFTGCTSEAIDLCNDKFKVKKILNYNDVPTPEFQLFESGEEKLALSLEQPLIIKPVVGHASRGIEDDSVVYNEESLRKQVNYIIKELGCPALAECYVAGREFCIPMLGNDEAEPLPLLEINYISYAADAPKILTYKAKWSKNSNVFKNTDSMVAVNLDVELKSKIEAAAKGAFKSIGCTGYATADVRVDKEGNVYVIDVNPDSYIAEESDFVKAAAVLGWSYQQLLEKIMQLAVERCVPKVLIIMNSPNLVT